MKSLEIFDILTLEDGNNYVISNMLLHNDNEYLYLIQLDRDEKPLNNAFTIVRRVIKDGKESVAIVLDSDEFNEVNNLFMNLFNETTK